MSPRTLIWLETYIAAVGACIGPALLYAGFMSTSLVWPLLASAAALAFALRRAGRRPREVVFWPVLAVLIAATCAMIGIVLASAASPLLASSHAVEVDPLVALVMVVCPLAAWAWISGRATRSWRVALLSPAVAAAGLAITLAAAAISEPAARWASFATGAAYTFTTIDALLRWSRRAAVPQPAPEAAAPLAPQPTP